MTANGESPADVSAMMEALWGPRTGSPAGPHDVVPAPPPVNRGPSGAGGEGLRGEIDALRSELGATAAALEARLDERIEGLARETSEATETMESVRAYVAADLGELEARMVTPVEIASLRAELEFQMVEQLRLVLVEISSQIDARVADVAAELSRRLDSSVSSDDFVALRSELKDALSRNMSSAGAALQARTALLDAAAADMRLQMTLRLEQIATLVATEAKAAAERVTVAALQRRVAPQGGSNSFQDWRPGAGPGSAGDTRRVDPSWRNG